jgi:non-catalytic primase subunit PriX-like protein
LPDGSLLSDLALRYPFAPRSRGYFESVSLEDVLESDEVRARTKIRLLDSLGRAKYKSDFSDNEVPSFFAAALVASQDPVLTSRFSKKEAERTKEFFMKEQPKAKIEVMSECFGLGLQLEMSDGRASYIMPFEGYLSLVAKYEISKDPKWKLSRQELDKGLVRVSDNLLNDFFGACALAAIADGVRNLRKGAFPKQLVGIKADVIQYVPTPRPKTNKGYLYVEDLLAHPVPDGRHRLVWLVLAPYLVNVKKVDDEIAIEKIRAFVAAAGETSAMRRFVEYNVRRARRNGLLPPTFATLKAEHPDIYWLLPKEVIEAETAKGKGSS